MSKILALGGVITTLHIHTTATRLRSRAGTTRADDPPRSRQRAAMPPFTSRSLYCQDLMMTMRGRLLTVASVVECLVGLAFVRSPRITTALLLGAESDSVGLVIGRVAGVALLSLGLARWGARADADGAARMGTLRAITLYNAGAGLLLVMFAATGGAGGPVVWIVGVLHLGFAAAFVASHRHSARP